MNVTSVCQQAKLASRSLAAFSAAEKNAILSAMADALKAGQDYILTENKVDLNNLSGKDKIFEDRLRLNESRIDQMIEGIRQIAALEDPVGEVTGESVRPNGLVLKKVRCPLGVVAIIYEARPNVTADAAALCIKSGNAVILKGGSGAINSNRAIYKVLSDAVAEAGFQREIITFIDDTDRKATAELLKQDKYIDVIIPRGGEGLKNFILENSTIPVIASAGGNCHVYVEKTADYDMAEKILVNAKCQRPSVCNAAESLLIDADVADRYLPGLMKALIDNGVTIKGMPEELAKYGLPFTPATEEDYHTEYHDLIMDIKVVKDCGEAIDRINRYGTCHSEAIITSDAAAAEQFAKKVDAAAVYVNASTRFTDGFEFGLGAEMGISTGKLHARGPLGLKELTTEKYVITGNGQVRK